MEVFSNGNLTLYHYSMRPFHPATWLRPANPIMDTAELLSGRPGPMSC